MATVPVAGLLAGLVVERLVEGARRLLPDREQRLERGADFGRGVFMEDDAPAGLVELLVIDAGRKAEGARRRLAANVGHGREPRIAPGDVRHIVDCPRRDGVLTRLAVDAVEIDQIVGVSRRPRGRRNRALS